MLFFPMMLMHWERLNGSWENKIENFSLAGFNGDRQLLRFPYPVSTGIQPVSLLADEMADFIKTNTVRQKWLPVELLLY